MSVSDVRVAVCDGSVHGVSVAAALRKTSKREPKPAHPDKWAQTPVKFAGLPREVPEADLSAALLR